MMITARALLDRIGDPDEDTIREAISGQICRCTGYTTIVRSIQWAASHSNGRAVESGPSETDFAPEEQSETTRGGEGAEPLLETGRPS
jgi:carbon-monoxide dehydrogenase small subunit